MNTKILNAKVLVAALGLLVAGGAVADASAATVTKTTVVAHRTFKPAVGKKVTIVRTHRPRHLVRLLPAHRLAPRVHVAKAFTTKRVAKTTVIR